MADVSFRSIVADALARSGLDPGRLALEITEGVLLGRDSRATTVEELKRLGVRLVLDDFGTGYSSLNCLKRFPLDALKIDQAFVSGLGEGEHDLHIAEAIVGMATALGLEVVAEGVGTAQQAERLLDLGCRLAQGYLFARPVPPGAVEELLRRLPRPGAHLPRAAGQATAVGTAKPVDGRTITLGEAAEALGVSASTPTVGGLRRVARLRHRYLELGPPG